MASRGGPSRPSRADKGKSRMIDENNSPPYSLNTLQAEHRTSQFTREEGLISFEPYRFRQHRLAVLIL